MLAIFVASHRREFGIRIALGGQRADVASVIVRRLGRLMVAGLAIGAFGSWGVMRALSAVVAGFSGDSLQACAAVFLLLMFTSVLAAYVPVRRASNTDVVRALRAE
jgi:putative ABC transport system permease protein